MRVLVADGAMIFAAWSEGRGLLTVEPPESRQAVETKLAAPVSVPASYVVEAGDDRAIEDGFEELQPGSIDHARRVFEAMGCDLTEVDEPEPVGA